MANIKQEQVLSWLRSHLGLPNAAEVLAPNGKLGPDLAWDDGRLAYCFEAIAFSDKTSSGTFKRGKNQSDFWKAFSQAISRLNPNSRYSPAHRVVIALPWEFLAGWSSRMAQIGESVWRRIGVAFPELEIWFVSCDKLRRLLSWNDAYNAGEFNSIVSQFESMSPTERSALIRRLRD